ncbi:hypothetical protein N8303_07335 [Gammaproteobacteria bacterium]|nr:hypothetical protein [Gammaproteobacteria bacterium]
MDEAIVKAKKLIVGSEKDYSEKNLDSILSNISDDASIIFVPEAQGPITKNRYGEALKNAFENGRIELDHVFTNEKNISGVIFFEGRLTRKYIKNNEDKNSSTHNFSIVCSEKGGAYKIEKLLILKDL